MKLNKFGLLLLIRITLSLAPNEIIIFILSQQEEYYLQLAQNLRSEIYNQSIKISKDDLINVHLMHEIFNNPGDWTFLTILPKLAKTNLIKSNIKWIILCEDQSYIDLEILLNELNKEDCTKEKYLGHPIYDLEASIIHHFAFFEYPQWFPFPLIRSGVAFTIPLITRLTERVLHSKPTTEFFIDASHELSLFIWKNMRINKNNKIQHMEFSTNKIPAYTSNEAYYNYHFNQEQRKINNFPDIKSTEKGLENQIMPSEMENDNRKFTLNNNTAKNVTKLNNNSYDNNGMLLTSAQYFCYKKAPGCAIYPNDEINSTCKPVRIETIYFAIKTCNKFHSERIPIIESTWGRYVIYKRYFSDIQDPSVPTTSIEIENSITGHCLKTLKILKMAFNEIEKLNHLSKNEVQKIKWLFLSDDDTLLSISTLCDILGCFNSESDIYLGERYGYRLNYKDGFNYITGGGGIVFSLSVVKKILKTCTCPSISSPDDMIIGSCLYRLEVPLIHSSKFHQARPPDYSNKILQLDSPIVSFHKFWQSEPIETYEKWFRNKDDKLFGRRIIKTLENNNNCIMSSNCGKFKKNLSKSSNHLRKLQEHKEILETTTKTKIEQHIDL